MIILYLIFFHAYIIQFSSIPPQHTCHDSGGRPYDQPSSVKQSQCMPLFCTPKFINYKTLPNLTRTGWEQPFPSGWEWWEFGFPQQNPNCNPEHLALQIGEVGMSYHINVIKVKNAERCWKHQGIVRIQINKKHHSFHGAGCSDSPAGCSDSGNPNMLKLVLTVTFLIVVRNCSASMFGFDYQLPGVF